MARLQKKRLDDITNEADLGWFLNLAKNVGGANVGVNLNKDGGGLSVGKGPVSVGLGNLWKWNKGEKKRSAPDNKSTTSRQRYDVTLKPGQPGYKSLKRRRQEAAMRNQ